MKRNIILLFLILITFLFLSIIVSLLFGSSIFSLKSIIYTLLNPKEKSTLQMIIWQIRIPRIILGLFIGAGLASCGVVFQGILRNPLAEPYTLGISGGAALGVTLGIALLGVSGFNLTWFAFGGSLLSVTLIYAIAFRRQFSNPTLILAGVILNFLFSSLVLLIFSLSRSKDVHSVILWLAGDLSSILEKFSGIMPYFVLSGIFILNILGRDLNILTLGDEKATHLGLNVQLTKKILFIITSFITGLCVAAAGVIGFVGLIIPHFMRRFSGSDSRILIPASSLAGAIFLIFSDCLARTIIKPIELPVGVITGILGGGFFLVLLFRMKKWEIM